MKRQRPLRWRRPAVALRVLLFVVDLRLASAAATASTPDYADLPLLDWSEWDEPPPVLLSGRTGPTAVGAPTVDFSPAASQQQQLRRLVHECSRQLTLPGLVCGDDFIDDDDYRVPFIESLPSCGFEALTTKDAIENLAARYTFRFIGDSTTRRLTESFMSIVTGEGSTHPKVQTRIDFSTGDLKVVFDWAPFCSGPLSVGEMLTTVIAEESAEKQGEGNYKRPIIITAFGIHDASYQLQVSQNNIKDWYRDQMPQEIFKQDGFRAAGLAACREATAQFVRAATGLISAAGVKAGGDSPLSPEDEEDSEKEEEEEEGEGRGHDRGRRTRSRERRLQQRRESVAETVPGGVGRGDASQNNISISNNTEAEVSIAGGLGPPPLVFVLQNNGYNDHDDFQQMFLEEVRLIQRQEIGIGLFETLGETKIVNVDDEGAGVFLVDDSVSLYGKLACYRIEPSSHYHEPVKIVEGKVLWDLVALADRESGPALPTHGGSSDVNSSGRVGPAVVLAAGRWTAVVLILVGWLW